MAGILSYGFYIPHYRIKIDEIAAMWNKNSDDIKKSLNVHEKAVASIDEDSFTMAYEAGAMACRSPRVDISNIKAVFFGSESPIYAVKPTSTMLGELLLNHHNYLAYDTQFACKAGTGALISGLEMINAHNDETQVLVCAADKATGQPRDALEFTAASGAVSIVVGKEKSIVDIIDYQSYSSDTSDFWRRNGVQYPSHAGRFSGKPAYHHHILHASRNLLDKVGMKPSDFTYAVFHMPNGRFPVEISKQLGFSLQQIEPSLVVKELGNSYTASGLMGLIAVLEQAHKGDSIFFASYGSGAGSDAFVLKVNRDIQPQGLQPALSSKKYIQYAEYCKFMNMIKD